jgi:hypothetical protein
VFFTLGGIERRFSLITEKIGLIDASGKSCRIDSLENSVQSQGYGKLGAKTKSVVLAELLDCKAHKLCQLRGDLLGDITS